MQDEWCNILYVFYNYLTCEGRYVTTLNYHVHPCFHFEAELELNFLYFLHKILAKMSRRVQKHFGNPYNSLYHHGLINILIDDELHIRKDTWDNFVNKVWGLPSSTSPHSPHIQVSPQTEVHKLEVVPDPNLEPPLIELFSSVLWK